MSVPRLKMEAVRKHFGATQALRNVSFEVAPGEVHALIGENGAGKSTLMKILSGAHRPDGGHIEIDGKPFAPHNPLQARQHGVAMIYQELNLAPHLTVEENILLGAEPNRFGIINQSRRRFLARQALAELKHEDLPLQAPVYTRTIAEQQVVEIARAFIGSPRILILDEPTSSLTRVDTANLFKLIRTLKEGGVSVIYISHFLEECQQVADRYTVLRDGETVAMGSMAEARLTDIIRAMVGREVKDIYPRSQHALGKPVLQVKSLRAPTKAQEVSLTLREGEILGIAGLIGAGRTETLRCIFGLDPIRTGEITAFDRAIRKPSPWRSLRAGLGLLSENRKEEGLMLTRSIADNLTITRLEPFTKAGFLSNCAQAKIASDWIQRLQVKARTPAQRIADLSGGNQQKIALGRLLHHGAHILLLDEPTRGIDVASKAQIYQLMGDLAGRGHAIIFVSSYLPELLGVCHTIGVMSRGKLVAIRPAQDWTEQTIISAAIGQSTEQSNANS